MKDVCDCCLGKLEEEHITDYIEKEGDLYFCSDMCREDYFDRYQSENGSLYEDN